MRAGLINFAIERQRHNGFIGRAMLLAQLDQLLIEERADRWVVVTGGPGMGKSALLAAWLARREAAGDTVPHHFIRRGWDKWDDPATLVGSLVAQIEARFPEQRETEAELGMSSAARLATTLGRVSERELVPRGERLVVLIDGLDEYDPPPGPLPPDPLAAFLPYALPRGVAFVCASRPRHPYVDMLATRGVLVQLDLDDEQSFAADNEATVRAFWAQAAPELGLGAQFIAEAVERAGGNLQHAAMLRTHLAGLPPAQRRVEDIPRGLAALLASSWDRIATDPLVVDGLGVLCAAREALTLDELSVVAGWTGETPRRAFVRSAREVLLETRRSNSIREYRLHHDSIRAQVAAAIGSAALRTHHDALAQKLATWPAPMEATARRYALRHALLHRAEAGEWADAWRVASDMAFLEAKCRELGAHDADTDVARTADRCYAGSDQVLRKRFADLARALGRESHLWLRVAPEATAALVWNQLRRSGWTIADLDQQLQMPPGARFLRVRHVATRESPELERNLVGHADKVTACAVTADGRRVVSASDDKTLKVWDLATGQPIATLQGHAAPVLACTVTPDGRHVVSASSDKTLKVWDLATGLPVATLRGHADRVRGCAVTPDGQRVVSASDDKTVKVWNLVTGKPIATLRGHADRVRGCAVTPDGQRVISASDDKTLKVWDLATRQSIATLRGHAANVTACTVTPDGRRVVSASWDKTFRVWDLATGQGIGQVSDHSVTTCAVTPDGGRVVSASWDKTLKVWDLATMQQVATLRGHTKRVNACAVTPDGRRAISASDDKTLTVWDLASGQSVATLRGHGDCVSACAATPDGRRVVSASYDYTLKVWDSATGQPVVTVDRLAEWVSACAVTPDGARAVSASWDKRLDVWDLATGEHIASLRGHDDWVTACAFTPDGGRVVSASMDKTLKVWDLATRQPIATWQGGDHRVRACAVTPDGARVVSASWDNTLKVWDLATGQPVAILKGHDHWVCACAVTPDGRYVVSASLDTTLKVWDLATGHQVATLRGHAARVNACAVTPDGRRVVSASDDNTLKVWDLASRACCSPTARTPPTTR